MVIGGEGGFIIAGIRSATVICLYKLHAFILEGGWFDSFEVICCLQYVTCT